MFEARVEFTGKLGRDVNLRFLPSGKAVADVAVAVTGRKKEGEKWVDDTTTWFKVTTWGKLAENAAESVVKGDEVHVIGWLTTREYEKDGEKRTALEVNAEVFAPSIRFRSMPHSRQAREREQHEHEQPSADPWETTPTDHPGW